MIDSFEKQPFTLLQVEEEVVRRPTQSEPESNFSETDKICFNFNSSNWIQIMNLYGGYES